MLFSSSSSATPGQPLPLDQPPPSTWARADAVLLARLRGLVRVYLADPTLTPARLAEVARLSERTLYRRLRHLTGHTPASFVRELRLLRARQLLHLGELPTVAAVAHAVGFVNAAHFGRAYARRFGRPPGQEGGN
jgi:transcriptional regulator GlxA family with amidase domain